MTNEGLHIYLHSLLVCIHIRWMFVEIFILVTYHMYSMLKALHFLFMVGINILSNYFSTFFVL